MVTDIVRRDGSPPTRVGAYQLLHPIGSGGAGQVWLGQKAVGTGAGKFVAIKLTERNALGYGVQRQMFETEARVAGDLRHSNIVQVVDALAVDGRGVLVMEWVDGTDLARFSHRRRSAGRLPDPIIRYIIGEVLTGLAYAHGLIGRGRPTSVIHRDISPHNVLLSTSGEVKITDFGIAQANDDSIAPRIAGKPSYMAPEQARGQRCTTASDLFSVGAILYELLEGKPLYVGLDGRELFDRAAAGLTPQLRHARPSELSQLCLALLDPNPLARPSSALEALRQLDRGSAWGTARVDLGQLVRALRPASAPQPLTRERSAQPHPSPYKLARGRSRALASIAGFVCIGLTHWTLASVASGTLPPSPQLAHHVAPDRAAVTNRPTHSIRVTLSSAHSLEPAPSSEGQARSTRPKSVHSKRSHESTPAPTRSRIELFAHELFYVEVELDGRVLCLDPKLSVEVEAGSHQLRIRSPRKPWRDLGPLIVEADKHYRVSFERAGGYALDTSDWVSAQPREQIEAP